MCGEYLSPAFQAPGFLAPFRFSHVDRHEFLLIVKKRAVPKTHSANLTQLRAQGNSQGGQKGADLERQAWSAIKNCQEYHGNKTEKNH